MSFYDFIMFSSLGSMCGSTERCEMKKKVRCDCEEKYIWVFFPHSATAYVLASLSLLVGMISTGAAFLVGIFSWNYSKAVYVWFYGCMVVVGVFWLIAEILDRRAAALQHAPRPERRRQVRERRKKF